MNSSIVANWYRQFPRSNLTLQPSLVRFSRHSVVDVKVTGLLIHYQNHWIDRFHVEESGNNFVQLCECHWMSEYRLLLHFSQARYTLGTYNTIHVLCYNTCIVLLVSSVYLASGYRFGLGWIGSTRALICISRSSPVLTNDIFISLKTSKLFCRAW